MTPAFFNSLTLTLLYSKSQRFVHVLFSVVAMLLLSILATQVSARSVSPFPEGFSIGQFRGQPDTVLYITVVGSTDGSIWGSNPYTDDSSLSKAAVHAGLLQAGQKGVIKVTIMAGLTTYPGSNANGISSTPFGSWGGSFHIAADDGGDNPVIPAPLSMTGFRAAAPGSVYLFSVTGATPGSGSIWGTNVYTDDSHIATAAVHAGVVRADQSATVRVVTSPGRNDYAGSSRNGINSNGYGRFSGSYSISDPSGATALHAYPGMQANPLPDPGSMHSYRGRNGTAQYFQITGSTSGSLWGTNTYTDDSTLSTAAVHAGVAHAGQTKVVKATVMPGQSSYSGSTSNGVKSNSYGSYGGSYSVSTPDGALGTIPMISNALNANASEGKDFVFVITANHSPTVLDATGLPEGLSVNSASGLIIGTPKVSGVFRIQLLATNDSGTSNAELVLTVAGSGTPNAFITNADCLFDWADANYPEFFSPAKSPSKTLDIYYYRYYLSTDAYLGVSSADNHVYYIGPLSGGNLLDLGDLADWLKTANCPSR
jgi:hypothetical protein